MAKRRGNAAALTHRENRGVAAQPLGEAEQRLVRRAYELFERFQNGLAEAHEEMRQARRIRHRVASGQSMTAPAGNTLGSCMDNVIADQVDNLPEAQLLPEREETARSAEEMSDVVSYVLYQAGWPGKYQTLMEDAIVTGTGVVQVFWDEEAEDGAGMVNVLAWHPEDFYPDPAAENVQDGRACFKATHTTVAWVEERYPHARGYIAADRAALWDEETATGAADDDERTTLLEYWYKRYDAQSRRTRVHMALLAGGALLYSTELGFGGADKGEYAEGVYAHGQYPFTLYKYRQVWRRPFGSGMAHDYSRTQEAIDRYIQYIDDNARESSVQRHFIRRGSGVNPEDVADMRKTIIEWEGSDIREVMQTVQAQPLSGQVYQMMTYLADAMKQDCGQNQFIRGEAGLGVTAASAIQALQDAGSKIMRWHTAIFKDAFREMVEQIIWVMSEYLAPGRTLRIAGGWDSSGQMRERLVTLIAPDAEGDALMRPAYAVRVDVRKSNPLQIQADNEFLQQVVDVCAKAGEPLPPEAVVRLMEGYRTKASVLAAVEESSAMRRELERLRQENEALRGGGTPGMEEGGGALELSAGLNPL